MIEAVLWDFGGVLSDSPFENFNRYEHRHGLPLDFIRTVNATNPDDNAWARLEADQISVEEFDQAFADESEALGHRIRGIEVLALLSGAVRPSMVRALRLVKQSFKVGCLTNNVRWGAGPGMSENAARTAEVAGVMALFDVVVESSVEGLRKPQPAFYELALRRLGLDAAAVVYIDDLGINLKPARALGMTTIKAVSEAQTLRDLGDALSLKLL